MRKNSLRFRLFVAAVVSIIAALIAANFGLATLFEHHVERRVEGELDAYLNQILGSIRLTDNGQIQFTLLDHTDPRFNQPMSGLYWQIQDDDRSALLRSRSLWDVTLKLPKEPKELGVVHQYTLVGPADRHLLVRERQIVFLSEQGDRHLRVAIALEKREVVEARNAFAADMLPYIIIVVLVLMAANWLQIQVGLAPLSAIHRDVAAIRSGVHKRLATHYPGEVMPLVNEMNELLEAQEQAVERARAWTEDLAHGLKTPLTILSADAQRLRDAGNLAIADNLDQLAETMRVRVDRELIRARVRSGAQTRQAWADVSETLHRIVRTLQRSPRGMTLDWNVQAQEPIFASIRSDDLIELLGNLLENATQWANHAISATVLEGDSIVTILIEDDGPGVPDGELNNICQRGVRLDEQRQGSGLGLNITQDIVEAYQGNLSFGHAALGGLAVIIKIPSLNEAPSLLKSL